MKRFVALLLSVMAVTAYAKQPLEPDEGGMGGTGNGVDYVNPPAGLDRPEMPERVEVPEFPGADLPDLNGGSEGMGGDFTSPPDIPNGERPPRD